ncbi:MAG: enoyl-CoA hydratase/isomerase family protein [Acidimicrobiia bacterium]
MVEEVTDGALLVERPVEHVVVLTMNYPERLNAVGGELSQRLTEIWPEIDADPTVRVVVLTGAGRGFCSGADLTRRGSGEEGGDTRLQTVGVDSIERRGGVGYTGPGAQSYPRFTARQAHVYKPVITAVNGVCAGAGLHFVADSDIVICADGATFVDTHVNVGQVTALEPIGLTRRMPFGLVTRMVCLGKFERMSAQRAFETGMVSEVVPGDVLMARALELAQQVAQASPATLQTSLRAIWESLEYGLTDAYYHGFMPLTRHWDHPDASEGPRAFMDKRDPEWAS